jgi:flagellar assembly factor FliW
LKLQTTRFGAIDIHASKILTVTDGIIGFAELRRYVLLDHEPNSPFKWLQSVDRPDLAFVVTDPLLFVPDYRAEVRKEDIDDLQLEALERAVVVCIVNIGKGCTSVTANLVAPLVINHDRMRARQVVLADSGYSIRHDLLAGRTCAQGRRPASGGCGP